jgi:hypothetical protein
MTNLVENIDDDISFGHIVGIRKCCPIFSLQPEKQYIVMNCKDYRDTQYITRYLLLKLISQPYIRSMNPIEDMNVILQYEKRQFYNDKMYLYCVNDAVTSFGSSGGALVNKEGQIVGITTQSYSDLLGSLGYAISMDTVGPWVQSQTGNAAITSTLEGRLLELMSRTKDLNKTSLYQSTKPPFSLTRPADWKFTQYDDTELYIDKPTDKEGGVFDLTLHRLPRQVSYEDIQTYLQANAFDAGVSSVINIADKGLVTFGNTKAKKYTITGSGTNSDAYYILQGDYFMVVTYKYGKDDKDKAKIDSIITSFKLGSYQFTGTTSSSFKSDNPKFSYTLSSGWVIQALVDSVSGTTIAFQRSTLT